MWSPLLRIVDNGARTRKRFFGINARTRKRFFGINARTRKRFFGALQHDRLFKESR
jgi:hypothetical protein